MQQVALFEGKMFEFTRFVLYNICGGKAMEYRPRFIDKLLVEMLEAVGAVLITGPKWCGKTTTAAQFAKSAIYMHDPDKMSQYRSLAAIKPSRILEGETPRLIDEWQAAVNLWDAVRFEVDQRNLEGQFILTGSVTVDESKIMHSGVGRIARLQMRTMSLSEQGLSSGSVSLGSLLGTIGSDGKRLSRKDLEIKGFSDHDASDIAKILVQGGFPSGIGKSESARKKQLKAYCDTLARSEIQMADGVERSHSSTLALMKSLSRHVSTSAKISTITDDLEVMEESLHRNTVSQYISALKTLYIVDNLPAWSPKLRSKSVIRTSDKRHLADPAIAAYFLNAGQEDLLNDLKTFGLLFESMVIRDLRVYADYHGAKVSYYLDSSGLEADAIIHFIGGAWGAAEIKLNVQKVDEAAESLKKVAQKVAGTMPKPSFLMVITSGGYAYEREDGVVVCPIGCLGI